MKLRLPIMLHQLYGFIPCFRQNMQYSFKMTLLNWRQQSTYQCVRRHTNKAEVLGDIPKIFTICTNTKQHIIAFKQSFKSIYVKASSYVTQTVKLALNHNTSDSNCLKQNSMERKLLRSICLVSVRWSQKFTDAMFNDHVCCEVE